MSGNNIKMRSRTDCERLEAMGDDEFDFKLIVYSLSQEESLQWKDK